MYKQLTLDEVRALYLGTEDPSIRDRMEPMEQEDYDDSRDTAREHAFATYCHRIIKVERRLPEELLQELIQRLDEHLFASIACGMLGEAAIRRLLPLDRRAEILALLPDDTWAHRQLEATLLVDGRSDNYLELVPRLFELKAMDALREVVEKLTEHELREMLPMLDDKSVLYKSNRAILREQIHRRLRTLGEDKGTT